MIIREYLALAAVAFALLSLLMALAKVLAP